MTSDAPQQSAAVRYHRTIVDPTDTRRDFRTTAAPRVVAKLGHDAIAVRYERRGASSHRVMIKQKRVVNRQARDMRG